MIPAILAGIAMLTIVGLMFLLEHWWDSWRVARALKEGGGRLVPESLFVVRLTESEVVCERPDGKVERVAWSDLQTVEVVTTSDGPMSPDVFWVLHGTNTGCAIPQGATGEKEFLDRLFGLPGFSNGAVIEAMTWTADRRFLCWEKKSEQPANHAN